MQKKKKDGCAHRKMKKSEGKKETHCNAGPAPAGARTAPGSCRCIGARATETATPASTPASSWPSPSAWAAPAAASTTTKPYART
jgi:hypothetical protein